MAFEAEDGTTEREVKAGDSYLRPKGRPPRRQERRPHPLVVMKRQPARATAPGCPPPAAPEETARGAASGP
jgi:hypothetical protein